MKPIASIFLAACCLLSACHSIEEGAYRLGREFYTGNTDITSRSRNEFLVRCPSSWGLIWETHFDGRDVETGMMIGVVDYEWSPVVQFNKLGTDVKWTDDLARLDVELSRRQELRQVQIAETLTSYNKFTGHGVRKVGVSRGRQSEFIIFYPDGEMAGTRLLVLLYGSPNKVSLRELDGVIRSAAFNKK